MHYRSKTDGRCCTGAG